MLVKISYQPLSCFGKHLQAHNLQRSGARKRIDYILKRQRGRNLVRDVKVHRQPNFIPISDHYIVVISIIVHGRFPRNCRVRMEAKPRIDYQCLTTDLDIELEVVTAVAK